MPVLNVKVLHEQIYDILKDRIITGYEGYEPGSKCNISKIAEELQVSVTPVKEALKKLENDGLINMKPRSGTYIKKLNKENFSQIIAVRKGLEKMAFDVLEKEVIKKKEIKKNINDLFNILDDWEKQIGKKDLQNASKNHINFHKRLIKLSENKILVRLYSDLIDKSSLYIAYHSNEHIMKKREVELHRNILDSFISLDEKKFKELINYHFTKAKEVIVPKL
jgi:DNA-binding GntR family transcriptional regulator